MMKLSTMWRVDATIVDDGSSPVAERILEVWAYDPGSLHFFRSSANFTYRFQDQGKGRFLRFVDGSDRHRDMVEAELAIVQALAAAGLDVAAPVPSKLGHAVETVETTWGTFHAVVFPALDGQRYECDELSESGFQAWGVALGRLHAATSPLADVSGRPSWSDHLAFIRGYLPQDHPGLQSEFDDLASSLAALSISRETYGLIHGDFEQDNLVWQGNRIGILDFDDCAHMWYAADVAWALRDLLESGADMDDARARAFVEGYREQRPLNEESLSTVPLFLRLSRLHTYARLARTIDIDVKPEYAQWLLDLRGKLRATHGRL